MTTTSGHVGAGSSAASFEEGTVRVVHAVRDAFARIIEYRCPGSKVVTSLSEGFGIHRKLAWQVSKVAYSDDPFVAARHIPSGKGLGAWLDAAREVKVPEALVATAAGAVERFESFTSSHAGSRDELEMLLESCARAGDVESHERWREQAFKGNSFVWGAHCRVLMGMMVLAPSPDKAHHIYCAQVRGLMGYRQTRPGVKWTVNHNVVKDDEKMKSGLERVPIDEEAARAHGGVPVMPRFCSNPMPVLSRRATDGGLLLDEFISEPVGNSGERTLVTGEVVRNIGPLFATRAENHAYFGTGVRIPAEVLHQDLFVHKSLFGGASTPRELRVLSDLSVPVAFQDADVLPIPERVSWLGRGVSLAQTPDVPSYTDLANAVFDALGAPPDEYDLFRVRLTYPPMPVSVMIRQRLPVAPAGG